MKRVFAKCIVGLVPLIANAGSTGGDALVPEIMARTLGPTPILADLVQLTDEIGGRPSGSAALAQATTWGVEEFRAAGLENVHSEPYTAAILWVPGVESGEVTRPAKRPLAIAALPFSSPTGPEGIEADVASVGHGGQADFAAAKGKLTGRWVLVETEPMHNIDDLDAEYLNTPRVFLAARRAGAVGVLWTSTRSGRLLYRHPVGFDDAVDPLPGAMLDREDALRISRALARGESARVKIVTTPRIESGVVLANVVGEIRGDSKQSESIVLGAHLDSWDLGQGALDNGCNVALVIDAARQMAAVSKKHRPARTIRFVLYTGEEVGFLGSRADVRSHRANLDHIAAMITFDTGCGRTTGFSTGGRADVVAAADAALEPASSFGPFKQTTDAYVGCDNYDYLVEGIPTFVANQDTDPYLPNYHASSDTYDKVDERELKVNTAIAAVFTWDLANADSAPGRRQTRSEVEGTLKTSELDKRMQSFRLWDDFLSGARGRSK